MSGLRAKFTVDLVTNHSARIGGNSQFVVLSPVINDGSEENKSFSQATPSGKIELMITNPQAHDFFKPNDTFYIDFTKVEPVKPAPHPEAKK